MILVANLISSASFHCEKVFKFALGTMLFCCRVNIRCANTFLKLSEATTRVFRVYLKISQISQEKICVGVFFLINPEGLQLYLRDFNAGVFLLNLQYF